MWYNLLLFVTEHTTAQASMFSSDLQVHLSYDTVLVLLGKMIQQKAVPHKIAYGTNWMFLMTMCFLTRGSLLTLSQTFSHSKLLPFWGFRQEQGSFPALPGDARDLLHAN